MLEYTRILAELLLKTARFQYHRVTAIPMKPLVLSLALTNRCNSHCIMCNIWKRSKEFPNIKDKELSFSEIINLLSNPLFSELVELDLTGGEPHLRKDLVDIVGSVARLKKQYLPNLKSIVITSNGLIPDKIESNYKAILDETQQAGIDLVSVTSIDGIGKIHDRVRGTERAFALASETIERLVKLKQDFRGFIPGIKTTILPQNVCYLGQILDYAKQNDLFHIISPVFFTRARFLNLERKDELKMGHSDYNAILLFYNRADLGTGYIYSQIKCALNAGKRQWGCTAFYNYLFVDYDGKVYPCELLSTPAGDLRRENIENIWSGIAGRRLRCTVGKTVTCQNCIEPGAIRYSACAEGWSYFKFLINTGKTKYKQSLFGEGYNKYFPRLS